MLAFRYWNDSGFPECNDGLEVPESAVIKIDIVRYWQLSGMFIGIPLAVLFFPMSEKYSQQNYVIAFDVIIPGEA